MSKKIILIAIAAFFTVNVWGQTTSLTTLGSYVWNATDEPKTFTNKLQMSFVRSLDDFPSYGTVLAGGGFNNTGQDGGVFQIYFPYGESLGGIAPKIRLGKYDNQGWSNWETFYTSANANLATVDWAAKDLIVSGNVGIGTDTPARELEVTGAGNVYVRITAPTATDWSALELTNTNETWQIINDDILTSSLRFHSVTSAVDAMIIKSTGEVGIGTTTPDSELDVEGELRVTGSLGNLIVQNSGAVMKFTRSSANYIQASTGGYLVFNTNGSGSNSANANLVLHTSKSYFPIGNVGIGTTTPTYKLSVKGTIGCGEVIVEDLSTWADFVFEPTYKLMPLKELDTYIQENKHLPEIPTTAEVKENGISVGEMNAKLLQKIEELTLYTIQQQELIEALKQGFDAQNNEIKELKELKELIK